MFYYYFTLCIYPLYISFFMYICISSLAREDGREPNQADLPEVDPEENSQEFMGILIKVQTGPEHHSL